MKIDGLSSAEPIYIIKLPIDRHGRLLLVQWELCAAARLGNAMPTSPRKKKTKPYHTWVKKIAVKKKIAAKIATPLRRNGPWLFFLAAWLSMAIFLAAAIPLQTSLKKRGYFFVAIFRGYFFRGYFSRGYF